jgi:hypothetical protein
MDLKAMNVSYNSIEIFFSLVSISIFNFNRQFAASQILLERTKSWAKGSAYTLPRRGQCPYNPLRTHHGAMGHAATKALVVGRIDGFALPRHGVLET